MIHAKSTELTAHSHNFVNQIELVLRQLRVLIFVNNDLRAGFVLGVVEIKQSALTSRLWNQMRLLERLLSGGDPEHILLENRMMLWVIHLVLLDVLLIHRTYEG